MESLSAANFNDSKGTQYGHPMFFIITFYEIHVLAFWQSTVVILINATTLMHKSNLSTNNSGNNHFGQKYQKQNIRRIFRRL